MAFSIRVRLLRPPRISARVRVGVPQFDWLREFDRDETVELEWPGDDLDLEIAALLGENQRPVSVGARVHQARGLDIDQTDEKSLEVNVLHARTPMVEDRSCELMCLSTNEHRKGPGCLDCAVDQHTIRICC